MKVKVMFRSLPPRPIKSSVKSCGKHNVNTPVPFENNTVTNYYIGNFLATGQHSLKDEGVATLVANVRHWKAEAVVIPYLFQSFCQHHEVSAVALSTMLSLLLEIPADSPQGNNWIPIVVQEMDRDAMLKNYPNTTVVSLRCTALAVKFTSRKQHEENFEKIIQYFNDSNTVFPRNVIHLVLSKSPPGLLTKLLTLIHSKILGEYTHTQDFPLHIPQGWARTLFKALSYQEFSTRSRADVLEWHLSILYLIENFPTLECPEIATLYLPAILKTYSRFGLAAESSSCFDLLLRINPYLKAFVSEVSLQVLLLIPLRQWMVNPKSTTALSCWEATLHLLKLSVQMIPDKVGKFAKAAITVALHLDGNGETIKPKRLIELYAVLRMLNVLQGPGARETMQHVIQALLMSTEDEPTFVELLSVIDCATGTSPFKVMDACQILLQALAEGWVKHSQSGNYQNLASKVIEWCTRRLQVVGAQINIMNYTPIALQLIKLGLRESTCFTWKCGCGAENLDTSPSCWKCLRIDRTHWLCKSCSTRHALRVDTCKQCGEDNPWHVALKTHEKWYCTLCRKINPSGQTKCGSCGGDGERQETVCKSCGHINWRGFYTCFHCGTPGKSVDVLKVSVWKCEGCLMYNLDSRTACMWCEKQGQKLTRSSSCTPVMYFQWKCGCGALNSPMKHACMSCRSRATHYTCPSCSKTSNLVLTRVSAGGTNHKFARCEHCRALHPRDLHLCSATAWGCVSCNFTNLSPSIECGSCHVTHSSDSFQMFPQLPWTCIACGSTSNPSGSHQCTTCQTVRKSFSEFSEILPWNCEHCGKEENYGFSCQCCSHVSPRINFGEAFVWKCERVDDAMRMCDSWNPSWEKSCSVCKHARVFIDEVRAIYSPWKCSECSTANKPTTVARCVKCRTLRDVEYCPKCTSEHLTYHCPTQDEKKLEMEFSKIFELLEKLQPGMGSCKLPPFIMKS
eukprot:PhF_6_TR40469/c0_g1_i1/m.60486